MTEPALIAPPPLKVAASLVAIQGVALVALSAVEIAHVQSERVGIGASTAVFFAAYGALLVFGAWSLFRLRSWARGPALLSQLIMLGIAWNVRDAPALAVVLAVAALVCLAGIVHPASIAALERAEDPTA